MCICVCVYVLYDYDEILKREFYEGCMNERFKLMWKTVLWVEFHYSIYGIYNKDGKLKKQNRVYKDKGS